MLFKSRLSVCELLKMINTNDMGPGSIPGPRLTSPGWSGTGPASCSSPWRQRWWCCCWWRSAAGTAGGRCCSLRRRGPASWWGTALQPLSSRRAAGQVTAHPDWGGGGGAAAHGIIRSAAESREALSTDPAHGQKPGGQTWRVHLHAAT